MVTGTRRRVHGDAEGQALAGARPSAAGDPIVRSDNRLPAVLDAAAKLFAERGYAASSMRDIADACQMLPGSLYYHFAAKDDLLAAVYASGVAEMCAALAAADSTSGEPWDCLEAACVAHLETMLRHSDYARVLVRVLPEDVPAMAPQLKELRAEYERGFRELIDRLPVRPGTDRRALRLLLMGALNWTRFWFDPSGEDTPATLARKFVGMLRQAQHD